MPHIPTALGLGEIREHRKRDGECSLNRGLERSLARVRSPRRCETHRSYIVSLVVIRSRFVASVSKLLGPKTTEVKGRNFKLIEIWEHRGNDEIQTNVRIARGRETPWRSATLLARSRISSSYVIPPPGRVSADSLDLGVTLGKHRT